MLADVPAVLIVPRVQPVISVSIVMLAVEPVGYAYHQKKNTAIHHLSNTNRKHMQVSAELSPKRVRDVPGEQNLMVIAGSMVENKASYCVSKLNHLVLLTSLLNLAGCTSSNYIGPEGDASNEADEFSCRLKDGTYDADVKYKNSDSR